MSRLDHTWLWEVVSINLSNALEYLTSLKG